MHPRRRRRPAAPAAELIVAAAAALVAASTFCVVPAAAWRCPNMCSGHGVCHRAPTLGPNVPEAKRAWGWTGSSCACEKGWTGGDCSERSCPASVAWWNPITGNEAGGHAPAACSHMGRCNLHSRGYGDACTCRVPFAGSACQRLPCAHGCNGHGTCVSLRLRAREVGVHYTEPWDYDKIFGCNCDAGWDGYDCTRRTCPTGDDPMTAGVNEVQLFACSATGGHFTLAFRGGTTGAIAWDATAAEVAGAVESLPTLVASSVSVSFLKGVTACKQEGDEVIRVEFLRNFGDLPVLTADGNTLDPVLSINGNAYSKGENFGGVSSATGTKEDAPCSNRGFCDIYTGECLCSLGWASSDGYGGPGTRNDCGYSVSTLPRNWPRKLRYRADKNCGNVLWPMPAMPPLYEAIVPAECNPTSDAPCCGKDAKCAGTAAACDAGDGGLDYRTVYPALTAEPDTNHCPGTETNFVFFECNGHGRCNNSTCTTNADPHCGACACDPNWFGPACGHHAYETIRHCPGEIACSGHGVCDRGGTGSPDGKPTWSCDCAKGWFGGDCSQRRCPRAVAWWDTPSEDQRAHGFAECSNMGTCDNSQGTCQCREGFSGAACERLTCDGFPACSGHGRCLTMAQLARATRAGGGGLGWTYGAQGAGARDPAVVGLQVERLKTWQQNQPSRWDADKIHGCHCDAGWAGYRCSHRSCPGGNNPNSGLRGLAPDTPAQYREVQVLRCTGAVGAHRPDPDQTDPESQLDRSAGGGSFALFFRGERTRPILHTDRAADVKAKLEELSTITGVEVAFSDAAPGARVCTADGSNFASVTFDQQSGDVPALLARQVDPRPGVAHVAVAVATDGAAHAEGGPASVRGTRDDLECSARGVCDRATGVCRCFSGYASSDGNGNAGTNADCGHRLPYDTSHLK